MTQVNRDPGDETKDLPIEERLPILEIQLGSLGRPASEILKELGYENPEELRRLRKLEDDSI